MKPYKLLLKLSNHRISMLLGDLRIGLVNSKNWYIDAQGPKHKLSKITYFELEEVIKFDIPICILTFSVSPKIYLSILSIVSSTCEFGVSTDATDKTLIISYTRCVGAKNKYIEDCFDCIYEEYLSIIKALDNFKSSIVDREEESVNKVVETFNFDNLNDFYRDSHESDD